MKNEYQKTVPEKVVPQDLLPKIREKIGLINSNAIKDISELELKNKETVNDIKFRQWPENIDKLFESDFKEDNYDYINKLTDKHIVWKRAGSFLKIIKNKPKRYSDKRKTKDDLIIEKEEIDSSDDERACDDIDIEISKFGSYDEEEESEIMICEYDEKDKEEDEEDEDMESTKQPKGKKKDDKQEEAAKIPLLNNIMLKNLDNKIINWVSSNLQVMIDQEIVDVEVS